MEELKIKLRPREEEGDSKDGGSTKEADGEEGQLKT